MDMDHQGSDGEERQQLDDHRDHELLEAQGDRRRSLSLEMSSLPKQQSSWQWQAAAASFRESLSRSLSHQEKDDDDEVELRWAAVERLPTLDRIHTSLLRGHEQVQVVDVRRLGAADTLVANVHRDNLRLLRKQRQRMDRVGVRPPTVEVRWRDVCVEAECQVVRGKPLPTIWNAVVSNLSVVCSTSTIQRRQQARIRILSGVVKPRVSRLTLLLGPPGCGKTTLLKALAGKLNNASSLKVTGDIEYNGVDLKDFVPEKTAALHRSVRPSRP